MNARIALWICGKELLEIRRDLRTLVLLVVLPALLYPLLMIAATKVGAAGAEKMSTRELTVAVEEPLPDEIRTALGEVEAVKLVDAGRDDGEGRPGQDADVGPEIAATVRVAGPVRDLGRAPVEIAYDGATELGLAARSRLRGPLQRARDRAHDERLLHLGVPPDDLDPASVDTIDVAPPARKGGFLLGRVMVPILVVILLLGAYYPAIDMTVGERERQTLRTLLCAPVPPMAIALGKLGAVTAVALAAATANLGGLLLTARIGILGVEGFDVPLSAVLLAFALLVPMAVYMGALLMAAASLTRSVREAQTMLTPLILILLLPAMGAALPGIEATWARALLPIFGPALVLREALSGTLEAGLVVAALRGRGATAVLLLGVASRAFTVESLLTGKIARPARVDGPLPAFDGVLLALALGAAFLYVGAPLQMNDLVSGLVLTQLFVFVGLPLGWAALRARHPLAALGLSTRPGPGAGLLVAGALLLLPTMGALVSIPAERLVDPEELKAFEEMAAELEALPGWAALALLSVLPGVCEEISFRGALMRAWSRRSAIIGVGAAALVFALFHGSAARFVPTLALGVLIGGVAFGARSTWASVVLHVAHNGFALLVAASVGDAEVASLHQELPWWVHLLTIPGVVLLGLGAARARRAARG